MYAYNDIVCRGDHLAKHSTDGAVAISCIKDALIQIIGTTYLVDL